METVTKSGLRGRGGAGFPTGVKWSLCRANGKPNGHGEIERYIICNADEGDPGAFMDRSLLEGNPHSVIEGMIIGAFALGAKQGFVYVRAEYPLAVKHLQRRASSRRKNSGLLGDNILGSGLSFRIRLVQGAGAFVCGEETALIASIEGRVGEPHPRPPYPVEKGLFGKPTVINNVKTWASVGHIINRGAEWYSAIGTEKSKGTMVFSLVGKINNTGLVEVPMGITLHEMIYDIGGGIPNGRSLKAVQIGGPSGGCIPADLVDLPIDYEQLTKAGRMMGSGGMVVMDDSTCMVDVARYFMEFLEEESCGQCFPCRQGTQEMKAILTRICEGRGKEEDLRHAAGPRLADEGDIAVRPRPDRRQPGADHAALLPQRVPGAHPRRGLPGQGVQEADHVRDQPDPVRRLRRLRQGVRRHRDSRRKGSRPQDRPGQVHANAARAWRSANRKPCWFLRSDPVPKLRINGISVEVEPGTTVLEAIRFLGLPIPTLCHDDGLRDVGACRLCVVEVSMAANGRTRLLSACTLPAQDGMDVRTNSATVQRARKLLLELYVATCPQSKTHPGPGQRVRRAPGAATTRTTSTASSAACACASASSR